MKIFISSLISLIILSGCGSDTTFVPKEFIQPDSVNINDFSQRSIEGIREQAARYANILFVKADTNRDKKLNKKEVNYFSSWGPFKLSFNQVDSNVDNFISVNELIKFFTTDGSVRMIQRYLNNYVWNSINKNKDEMITFKEYMELPKLMSDFYVTEEDFKNADIDKNKSLDQSEFEDSIAKIGADLIAVIN